MYLHNYSSVIKIQLLLQEQSTSQSRIHSSTKYRRLYMIRIQSQQITTRQYHFAKRIISINAAFKKYRQTRLSHINQAVVYSQLLLSHTIRKLLILSDIFLPRWRNVINVVCERYHKSAHMCLAETQHKNSSFLGSSQSPLHLNACQKAVN